MDYSKSLNDQDNLAASPWESPLSPSLPTIGSRVQEYSDHNGFSESDLKPDRNATSNIIDEEERRKPDTEASTYDEQQQQQHLLSNSPPPQYKATSQQQNVTEGHRPEPQRYHRNARHSQQQHTIGSQQKLQARITGLERTGRKDPILRFDVHTNLPKFRTTQFRDVRRTHSEFCKLADHLISSNPEALVPAVPPALTSAGIGTDEDEARVKASLQKWLNYVCSNEILMRDDEMILFIESDFGYSPMLRRKQPATGVRRKVIKQFAPPPDDTPELQDARPIVKAFYLGAMDAGHKVDKLVKARKGLGLAESDFGVKLGSMNTQEPHQGLANAYRKLGKTIQTTGDFHAAQGTAEATTIGDPLQYHSQDALIVKETLTNRHILLRELLQAQQTTQSRLTAADRLKVSTSVRREKVDEAISSLEEAQNHEQLLLMKCQRVTSNLLLEQRRWFVRTVADLKLSIREYVIREIEAERRTLATLEIIRPDIRAIDSSGGLSRLGRETHPTTRRGNLASSQGAKGDAWSGVPRRSDQLNRGIPGGYIINASEEEEDRPIGIPVSKEVTDDSDRVDARNAASRLASATFL
ncbi:Vacuolar protein sorting-associated protein 17 [Podosphaera aphanis]|nr:Vacuolar protein sorting-associated protein 17 [Podosphaera aphanis]